MPCLSCLRENPIRARGLCANCYQRWNRTGSTEYQKWGKVILCSIKGCGKKHKSHGLCGMHLLRFNRHGDVNNAGPDSWGAKTKHPLYNAWAYLRRHRGIHPMSPEWLDFLQFIMDVGSRPSPKHKLFSADDTKPIGPGNFVWKEAVTQRVEGEDERTYANRRSRVYRAINGEAFAAYDLKRHYGMSRAEYDALYALQNGLCAICGEPETVARLGKQMCLAVDHCHQNGHVRELLCRKCNTGLGSFKDDPALLRTAIAYLEKHALPPATE